MLLHGVSSCRVILTGCVSFQGTDFHLIPREGFGWTNSSYQVGLSVITQAQRRALGALTPPDSFFRAGNVVRT